MRDILVFERKGFVPFASRFAARRAARPGRSTQRRHRGPMRRRRLGRRIAGPHGSWHEDDHQRGSQRATRARAAMITRLIMASCWWRTWATTPGHAARSPCSAHNLPVSASVSRNVSLSRCGQQILPDPQGRNYRSPSWAAQPSLALVYIEAQADQRARRMCPGWASSAEPSRSAGARFPERSANPDPEPSLHPSTRSRAGTQLALAFRNARPVALDLQHNDSGRRWSSNSTLLKHPSGQESRWSSSDVTNGASQARPKPISE